MTIELEFWVLPHGVRFASLGRGGQKQHSQIFSINITYWPKAEQTYLVKANFFGAIRCAPLSEVFVREQIQDFVQEYIDRSENFSFDPLALQSMFWNGIPDEMRYRLSLIHI